LSHPRSEEKGLKKGGRRKPPAHKPFPSFLSRLEEGKKAGEKTVPVAFTSVQLSVRPREGGKRNPGEKGKGRRKAKERLLLFFSVARRKEKKSSGKKKESSRMAFAILSVSCREGQKGKKVVEERRGDSRRRNLSLRLEPQLGSRRGKGKEKKKGKKGYSKKKREREKKKETTHNTANY